MFYLPVFQKSYLQEKLLQGKLMQKGCRAEPHLDNHQEHILIEARPRDSDSPDRLRQEFFEAAVRGLENALRRIGTDVILL
jgi:hypothetical protein